MSPALYLTELDWRIGADGVVSNSRPLIYEITALPLSYIDVGTGSKFRTQTNTFRACCATVTPNPHGTGSWVRTMASGFGDRRATATPILYRSGPALRLRGGANSRCCEMNGRGGGISTRDLCIPSAAGTSKLPHAPNRGWVRRAVASRASHHRIRLSKRRCRRADDASFVSQCIPVTLPERTRGPLIAVRLMDGPLGSRRD